MIPKDWWAFLPKINNLYEDISYLLNEVSQGSVHSDNDLVRIVVSTVLDQPDRWLRDPEDSQKRGYRHHTADVGAELQPKEPFWNVGTIFLKSITQVGQYC